MRSHLYVALFAVLCLLLMVSNAVIDNGYYRFNRFHQSNTMDHITNYNIVSIESTHFYPTIKTKDSSGNDIDHHSTINILGTDVPDKQVLWSNLNTAVNTNIDDTIALQHTPLDHIGDSSPSSSSSSSFITHSFAAAPSSYQENIIQYNSLLTSERWGHGWKPSISSTELSTALVSPDEPLPFKHPSTSQFNIVLNNDYIVINLLQNNNLFGPNYRPEIITHDSRGNIIKRTYPNIDGHTTCFYTGEIVQIAHDQVKSSSKHASTSTAAAAAGYFVSLSDDEKSSLQYTTPSQKIRFAVNACRGGFSATIPYKGERYTIHPAVNHLGIQKISSLMASVSSSSTSNTIEAGSLHIIYREDHDYNLRALDINPDAAFCPDHSPSHHSSLDENHDDAHHHHHHHDHQPFGHLAPQIPLSDTMQPLQSTLYLEWLLTSDAIRVANLGTDQTMLNTADIASRVSTIYEYSNTSGTVFNTPIKVILVNQILWTTDPWQTTDLLPCDACTNTGEVSVDRLLSRWNAWRNQYASTYDNGHLLSGRDFQSTVLGYAGVGQMCGRSGAGGINQIQTAHNPAFSSIVVAHELGHNWGSSHDGSGNAASCPVSLNIMSPSLSTSQTEGTYSQFSSCSIGFINAFIATPSHVNCMYNQPNTRWGDPVCGNGYIESGEQCDCGQTDCSLIDPCCDGTTCTLHPTAVIQGDTVNVQCSSLQPCCTQTCQIRPALYTCRDSLNECDISETCDGTHPECPVDLSLGPGHTCLNTDGYQGVCFERQCISADISCLAVGQESGIPRLEDCSQVSRSDSDYCRVQSCQRLGSNGQCFTFTNADGSSVYRDNGIPCGRDGYQCYNGNCININNVVTPYRWIVSDWDDCEECGTPQVRSAQCTNIDTNTPITEGRACPEQTAVYNTLSRPCESIHLGCVYQYPESEKPSNQMYIFGTWAHIAIVVILSLIFVLLWVGITLICFKYISRPAPYASMSEEQDDAGR